jgi:hypothetical protein
MFPSFLCNLSWFAHTIDPIFRIFLNTPKVSTKIIQLLTGPSLQVSFVGNIFSTDELSLVYSPLF